MFKVFALANAQITWNQDNSARLSWSLNCDFKGNDLTREKTTGSLCGSRCRATNGFTHFTCTNFEGETCFMKSGAVTKNNAVDLANTVCGILDNPNVIVVTGILFL